ncbi:MAG: hypothetical protein HY854_16580 [Burkholderiales bacterium]|nr:hypothetical protein [Burkholderiales bacterium]
MGPLIYSLCALTSLACCVLLWRAYASSGARLLFWSSACFALLTLNNTLLIFDKVVYPDVDLRLWRLLAALCAVCLLLFGLIWEEE